MRRADARRLFRSLTPRGRGARGHDDLNRHALESVAVSRIGPRAPLFCPIGVAYFRELPTSVNTVLTLPPTVETAVMMATAMRLAIKAYSIAVAPLSLRMKFEMCFILRS